MLAVKNPKEGYCRVHFLPGTAW